MPKKIKVPEFHDLEDERRFWDETDTEDLDPSEVEEIDAPPPSGPRRPLTSMFSVRFDTEVLDAVRQRARAVGVTTGELVRRWVAERLAEERSGRERRTDAPSVSPSEVLEVIRAEVEAHAAAIRAAVPWTQELRAELAAVREVLQRLGFTVVPGGTEESVAAGEGQADSTTRASLTAVVEAQADTVVEPSESTRRRS